MSAIKRDDAVLVSVVIPAYNAAGFIGNAINSVLSQTIADYEILVVNDGSPDTEQLERALAPFARQVRYLKQDHRGPSATRNCGIVSARGKYVAFLDSDDRWVPEHLETQLTVLESNPGLGLVYCNSQLVKNDIPVGTTFEQESQVMPVTFEALLAELCTVSLSATVALRKDLIDAGLFDEDLVRCEDFDLWLRMAHCGTQMTHHSQITVLRTISSNGLSASEYAMRCARFKVLEKVGASLALSQSQKDLLGRRLRLVGAMINLDRLKLLMYAGQFGDALVAAKQAASVLPTWKLRLAVSGLKRAPHLLRVYYRFHERLLAARNRRRLSAFAREARANQTASDSQLTRPRFAAASAAPLVQ